LPEEKEGAQKGDEEFAEDSAENHDGVSTPTEERVPGFVKRQIGLVEKEKTDGVGHSIDQEEGVAAEPGDVPDKGDRLPFVEFVFEEGHWSKRSKLDEVRKAVQETLLR
jgi:hypothetical protein